MIQVVRGHDLILHTLVVKGEGVLGGVTLEHVEVFHCELLVFVPTDAQTLVGRTSRLPFF